MGYIVLFSPSPAIFPPLITAKASLYRGGILFLRHFFPSCLFPIYIPCHGRLDIFWVLDQGMLEGIQSHYSWGILYNLFSWCTYLPILSPFFTSFILMLPLLYHIVYLLSIHHLSTVILPFLFLF